MVQIRLYGMVFFFWNFGSVNVCLRDVLNVRGLNVDEEVAGNLLTF